MIKVNCVVSNHLLYKVSVSGHANYDVYGKDIVCAAVSSIVTTTVNDILALAKDGIEYDMTDGKVEITVCNGNTIAIKLLNVMIDMLKDLRADYPQNIKIGG